MKSTKFNLKITFDRFLETSPYLGAVTLSRDGREFILDVTQSYTYDDEECAGGTEIQCDLAVNEDEFSDCPFDLTMEDLLSDDVSATFFIESDEEDFEIEQMILIFNHQGERKSISVEME